MLREVTTRYCRYFVDEKGRLQGAYTSRYVNGQISEIENYLDDQLHGERKIWDRNKNLIRSTMYSYGKRNGEHKEWYINGQLERHCIFVNGKLHGEFKTLRRDGTIYLHCFYVDEIRVSFKEIPYPVTEEDRMYFTLKYDLQLLPVEK